MQAVKNSTELAIIQIDTVNALELYTAENVDEVLEKIRKEATDFKPDISTKKGRAEIASRAYKVSRSKTALIELGDTLTEESKRQVKTVNTEKKRIEGLMDDLRDDIRKPLTDWENIDKERVKVLELRLDVLKMYESKIIEAETSEELNNMLQAFDITYDHKWEEFADRAEVTRNRIKPLITKARDDKHEYEKQQIELEVLREKEEKREQEERDQKIADEAAAEAKQKAEEKAANEKKAAEEKAESEKQEIEDQKVAAEEEAEEAKREKIKVEAKAAIEALEAADAVKAAEEKAEREKEEAATAAQEREEQAVQDEKDRVAATDKAEADAIATREADNKHRGKINSEALRDLMSEAGLTESKAKETVVAIAQGKIKNVKVMY